MTEEPKLPGMPGRSKISLERRERLIAAIVEVHRALVPMLEVLNSDSSLTMRFKVAGDALTVSIKPGKSADRDLQ
jgi:hypothetical protein